MKVSQKNFSWEDFEGECNGQDWESEIDSEFETLIYFFKVMMVIVVATKCFF